MKLDRETLDAISKFVDQNDEFIKSHQLKFKKSPGELEFLAKLVDEKHVTGTQEIMTGLLNTINGKDMSAIGVCLSLLIAILDVESEKQKVRMPFADIAQMGVKVYKNKLKTMDEMFSATSSVPS